MAHELVNGRWVARFRAKGAGRFFEAGFLLFWLSGWAVGEVFALGALVTIGLTYLPREWVPLSSLPARPDPSFAVAAGGFLGVWLAFWTLGGVMAMREVLRALWSSDEIQWDASGLILIRRLGPFLSRREIPADQILKFRDTLPRPGLAVDLPRGSVELTKLGTDAERLALKHALRSALPGRTPETSRAELPADWTATVDASGSHVLGMAPASLRLRSWISWIVGCGLVVAGVSILAAGIGDDATASETLLRLLGVLPMLAGLALIAFFAAGRSEIHVRPGAATFVRRVGPREWRRDLNVGLIRIVHDRDSDGDSRFTLVIHGDGRRHTVASALHDPAELLILGRWLEARIQRPLEPDREVTTDE